jgi:hypothetical protein
MNLPRALKVLLGLACAAWVGLPTLGAWLARGGAE